MCLRRLRQRQSTNAPGIFCTARDRAEQGAGTKVIVRGHKGVFAQVRPPLQSDYDL